MEPINWRCGNVLGLTFSDAAAVPEHTLLDVTTHDGPGFSIELPEDLLEALADVCQLALLHARHRIRTEAITW
jgi:hypothetical protein